MTVELLWWRSDDGAGKRVWCSGDAFQLTDKWVNPRLIVYRLSLIDIPSWTVRVSAGMTQCGLRIASTATSVGPFFLVVTDKVWYLAVYYLI